MADFTFQLTLDTIGKLNSNQNTISNTSVKNFSLVPSYPTEIPIPNPKDFLGFCPVSHWGPSEQALKPPCPLRACSLMLASQAQIPNWGLMVLIGNF